MCQHWLLCRSRGRLIHPCKRISVGVGSKKPHIGFSKTRMMFFQFQLFRSSCRIRYFPIGSRTVFTHKKCTESWKGTAVDIIQATIFSGKIVDSRGCRTKVSLWKHEQSISVFLNGTTIFFRRNWRRNWRRHSIFGLEDTLFFSFAKIYFQNISNYFAVIESKLTREILTLILNCFHFSQ